MNLHKIMQYNLLELFIIAFYKLIYKLLLAFELLRIKLYQPSFLNKTYNFNESQPSKFSAFYHECNKTNRDIIIKEADEILQGNINIFNSSIRFNHETDWLKDPLGSRYWDNQVFFVRAKTVQEGLNDVKFVLELNKLNHIVRVALAYYHTSEEKYINYIDQSIIGFVKCVPFERSVVNKIIMDISFRSINLIQISLLCWNNSYFVNNIYPIIHSLLMGYERQMSMFNTPRWFKTGNGVNHNIGEMTGLIICQLWLSQFNKVNFTKRIDTEFKYLFDVLNRTIAPSGTYLEQSANYSRVVFEFLFIFEIFINELYTENNHTKKYLSLKYRERLESYISDLLYNDKLPNFGDNDDARVLWAFINNTNDLSYLSISDNQKKNKPTPITKYLDGSQWLFKSNDNNKIYIFTRIGKLSYARECTVNHAHNDLLSVIISIRGHELFIDRGTSFYNSGKSLRVKDIQTSSHNTLYIENHELADIHIKGFKNYPISGIINDANSTLHAFVKYKNLLHKRCILYTGEKIIIKDKIQTQSKYNDNSTKKGSLNYLLASNITICKKTEKEIILQDRNSTSSFSVKFIGITSLNINETDYYESYAFNNKTLTIKCDFIFSNSIQLETVICLNE